MTRPRKPKPAPVLVEPAAFYSLDRHHIDLPIMTVSESNTRGHWSKRANRAKQQRGLVKLMLGRYLVKPSERPLHVVLTRIAPRMLDDDNLRGALKATRDGIADWLGIDDGSDAVLWGYAQVKGAPRTYGVRVEVLPAAQGGGQLKASGG